ncbi:MAG: hypothetical protein J0I41_01565 [Filimonas sp.]|nr:hypothetical protein [Filimonas sp.]
MSIIKFIKSLFKRSKTNQALYEQCAYHESGHIVMAYLSKFKCDSVTIIQDGSGNGFTKFDYGKSPMTELITSIVNFSEYPEMFNSLPPTVKIYAPDVAFKICGVLLGGPVSEAIYKAGIEFEGNLPIEVMGPDLLRVNSIHHLLSSIDIHHKPNYIKENLHSIVNLLRQEQVWKAVDTLSKDILASSTKSLSKQEIEISLQRSGYLNFINS